MIILSKNVLRLIYKYMVRNMDYDTIIHWVKNPLFINNNMFSLMTQNQQTLVCIIDIINRNDKYLLFKCEFCGCDKSHRNCPMKRYKHMHDDIMRFQKGNKDYCWWPNCKCKITRQPDFYCDYHFKSIVILKKLPGYFEY